MSNYCHVVLVGLIPIVDVSEPVVSHRCLGILTHPLGLKVIPSFSNNSFCFCQPGTSLPWLFTTRWQGRCCSSVACDKAGPTSREHWGWPRSCAIFP